MNASANNATKIVDLTGEPLVVFTKPLIADTPSDAQLFAVYQTLRGEQRRVFFHQHEQALMRALAKSYPRA